MQRNPAHYIVKLACFALVLLSLRLYSIRCTGTCGMFRDGVNSGIGMGIVQKSIPIPELELDLELFMSKLGGIGIGFGIAHLGIGIDHAQCAIS